MILPLIYEFTTNDFTTFTRVIPIYTNMKIIADHREKPSGVPDILVRKGVTVDFASLSAGDYLLENRIIFERKTAEDLIQSLISGRLFRQAEGLRKSGFRPCIIVEGNPYKTNHRISIQAVRGAFVSLAVAWQLPVVFSAGKNDTAEILVLASNQENRLKTELYYIGKRTGKKLTPVNSLLLGLPGTGPKTARALLKQFGSIRKIANAGIENLIEVKGIGPAKAARIFEFLNGLG